MGVGGEVERRRLQAAVRELGIHGATQVSIVIMKWCLTLTDRHTHSVGVTI